MQSPDALNFREIYGLDPNDLLGRAENSGLRNAIDELWNARNTPSGGVGDGSSMSAMIVEMRTGQQVRGKWHLDKVLQRRSQLMRLLSSGNLSASDAEIAGSIIARMNRNLSRARSTNPQLWRKIGGPSRF